MPSEVPFLASIKSEIITPIITFLIALAVVTFAYGAFEAVMGGPDKKAEGTQHMLWGVIGLFIMVSAVGVLNVVCNTIGCN